MLKKIKRKLKNYIIKGQIAPSSKYLVKKMLRKIDFRRDLEILQFGFGTGVFSKEIIKKMSPKSKLYIFEVRKECREYYNEIYDDRISYIEDSAEYVSKYFDTKEFDCVISTLPLANFPEKLQTNICIEIKNHLKENGCYLQYQYSLLSRKYIKKTFDKEPSIDIEFLNIPPAFIYKLNK